MSATRYRIRFSKGSALRFTGHLDLHRAWERTLRRAGLPVAFSEGFNPRPRINIGLALPLGCTSRGDLLDLWLSEPIDEAQLHQRLAEAAPPGLEIEQVRTISSDAPKLQMIIVAAEYQVDVQPADLQELADRAAALMAAEELPRERRGKAYDLRPLIEDLALRDDGWLVMRLTVDSRGTGRPDEVLRALGLTAEDYAPVRVGLKLSR